MIIALLHAHILGIFSHLLEEQEAISRLLFSTESLIQIVAEIV